MFFLKAQCANRKSNRLFPSSGGFARYSSFCLSVNEFHRFFALGIAPDVVYLGEDIDEYVGHHKGHENAVPSPVSRSIVCISEFALLDICASQCIRWLQPSSYRPYICCKQQSLPLDHTCCTWRLTRSAIERYSSSENSKRLGLRVLRTSKHE